jgi:hypothetical protein
MCLDLECAAPLLLLATPMEPAPFGLTVPYTAAVAASGGPRRRRAGSKAGPHPYPAPMTPSSASSRTNTTAWWGSASAGRIGFALSTYKPAGPT